MTDAAAGASFVVEPSAEPGSIRLVVAGEVDVATSPDLRRALFGIVDSGATRIEVDFADLRFIDSSGLGVLVAARNRLRETGHEHALSLGRLPDPIRRVFEITGLDDLFHCA